MILEPRDVSVRKYISGSVQKSQKWLRTSSVIACSFGSEAVCACLSLFQCFLCPWMMICWEQRGCSSF